MANKIAIGIAIGIEIAPNRVIAMKISTFDSDPDSDKDSDSIKMRIAVAATLTLTYKTKFPNVKFEKSKLLK